MNDPRRSIAALALVATTALLVAACGGASSPGASGADASTGASAAASADASTDGGANPSVDVNIGGGSVPDGFPDALVPPNSTVQSTISAGQGHMVAFVSTSSIDELKSFYDSAVASINGGEIFKMEAGGGFTWAWGEGESNGGLVIVAPNSEGGNLVSVTYGSAG